MKNQQLTDITRGLQHAAQTTLSLLAEQHIRTVDQFFVPEEDGIFKAKTVRVEIDPNHYVNIPLISLVPPKSLALEKMRVNMSVRLEETSSTDATSRFDSSGVTRSSFTVSTAPRGVEGERRKTDVIDMELEFSAGEAPEALMRVMDLFANLVTPIQPPEEVAPVQGPTDPEGGPMFMSAGAQPSEGKKPEYAQENWFKRYRQEYLAREKKKNPPLDEGDS